MKLGWTIVMAASMVAFAAGPAASQSPWPQAQPQAAPAQGAAAPWPQQAAPMQQPMLQQPMQQQPMPQQGQSPWANQGQQQTPPCVEEFIKLRKEVEKRGSAIQTAGQRKQKPSPKEACGLFNAFTSAEATMIKYATTNAASCGIPAQILDTMKQGHVKSQEIRTRVCQVAANGPPRAAAPPSLSDALSAPAPDASNIKTGRGTFDTLTGNPLGK